MKILHVEDNRADHVALINLMADALRGVNHAPEDIEWTHMTNVEEAIEEYYTKAYDLVLMDLGLPDAHGTDGIARFVEKTAGAAVIAVLSGNADYEQAYRCGLNGAHGYLLKSSSEAQKICGARCAIGIAHRRQNERAKLQEKAQMLADSLLAE